MIENIEPKRRRLKIKNLQKEETSRVVEIQKLPLSLDNLRAGLEFIINWINSATLAHEEITPESILENLNIYLNSILLVETTNIHNLTTGTNYHSALQQISSTVKQLENLVNEKIEAFLELNLIEKQARELEKTNQKQVKMINDLAEEKSASSVVKPSPLVATKKEELKDKDIENL
ncbi:3637_t:CDS:2, partial [Funneliformis geosporum]